MVEGGLLGASAFASSDAFARQQAPHLFSARSAQDAHDMCQLPCPVRTHRALGRPQRALNQNIFIDTSILTALTFMAVCARCPSVDTLLPKNAALACVIGWLTPPAR